MSTNQKHMDDNCIFCKIARGQIPSHSIYEDDDFKVIMDINPASRGHAIILPKNHAANLFELQEEDASKIMGIAQKCAAAMKTTLQYDGINILQNNGEIAGQTVFHLHVHLIPRYENDTVQIKWIPDENPDDPAELADRIRKNF